MIRLPLTLAKFGLQFSDEPVLGACIGILTSVGVYVAYFLGRGQASALFHIPYRAGWYFGAAGLASSLAIHAIFLALASLHASRVAPVTAAVPLVTLLLSRLVLHDREHVTWTDAACTVFIVGGVVLVVS